MFLPRKKFIEFSTIAYVFFALTLMYANTRLSDNCTTNLSNFNTTVRCFQYTTASLFKIDDSFLIYKHVYKNSVYRHTLAAHLHMPNGFTSFYL